MSNILTVFGATGVQGGSIIRAVALDSVLSKTFKIRAITRDTSASSAQELMKQGIEVVTVRNLGIQTRVIHVLNDAHTI